MDSSEKGSVSFNKGQRNGQEPLVPYLKLHAKANDNTTPASFKRGIINSISLQSWTADVQLVGNHTTVLKGIQLSSAINANAIRVGDRCRVDMFSEMNPNDMVIAYVYGRKMMTSNSGFFGYTGASANIKIPHSLGVIPTIAAISTDNRTYVYYGTYVSSQGVYISNTGPNNVAFDANYLYVTVETNYGGSQSYSIFWFVSCV
jgi:hypothetical protein